MQPDTPPVREIWDTSYIPTQDRFAYFREGVCQTSLAITPEIAGSGEFKARLDKTNVRQGAINRIDITPLRVIRTNADIAKIPEEYVALTFQLTGDQTRLLNGKEHFDLPGQSHLIDCNLPIDISARGTHTSVNLIFKRSVIPDHLGFTDIIKIDGPALATLGSCMRTIDERYDSASIEELDHLFDATIALLLAHMIHDKDFLEERCATEGTARSGLVRAIKDRVLKSLADSNMSTASMAKLYGISPRYVQKLFAAEQITFKSFVSNARLDRIKTDLADPSLSHLSSADIAFRWGFRDMTTFHRNFKQRFEDTPRQLRKLLS